MDCARVFAVVDIVDVTEYLVSREGGIKKLQVPPLTPNSSIIACFTRHRFD